MPIEYPWFFFRLIRSRNILEKFQVALNDPATLKAVGVEDPQMLIEYMRDHTEDDEVWMAACKLFPVPGQHELFGFHFGLPPERMGYLATPTSIIDLGRPGVNMVNNAGAQTWVKTYQGMVHEWCAQHRVARLASPAVTTE